MGERQKILIIRLSAMGDVAMTSPVIKQIAEQNPESSFVFLTRPLFKAFLEDIPNLTVFPFNAKEFKGFGGLYKLYKELRKEKFTAVADLHYNLRSRIISLFFRISGTKVNHIDKGRAEKKLLTRKTNKVLTPLPPTWLRYADVFKKNGLKAEIKNHLAPDKATLSEKILAITKEKNTCWIGISPFAQHLQKIYPLDKMEAVIQQLTDCQIFIFGGGKEEKTIAENWQNSYPNVISLIGQLDIKEELQVISNLDVMISMDSAGMHMASLKGVKTVSVWGATHPYAGFLGFGQDEDNCVQIDLYCRPCSVYGNKPCYRKDLACLNNITPELVIHKVKNVLKNV